MLKMEVKKHSFGYKLTNKCDNNNLMHKDEKEYETILLILQNKQHKVLNPDNNK